MNVTPSKTTLNLMKPTSLFLIGLGLLFAIQPNLRAQPVPHHFEGIAASSDRTITLSLGGSVSNMFSLSGTISNQFMEMFDLYAVETSPDLRDWTPLALMVRTNNDPNPLIVQDTDTAGLSQRFYRTFTNHLVTAFPKPSGPFAVGTVDRVMVDPARTNLYRYTPKTNAFMVTFWYPAAPPPAGVLPGPMWDKRFAADPAPYAYLGYDARWTNICTTAV